MDGVSGALGDPRFRRLLAGNSISSFGDSALYLSLGIWAKDLTGSNAAAGEVFLALGAAALTAPLGGQLADRVRRRPLLIVADAATGIVVLSLLFVHSRRQLWIIYAVAFAYGASRTVISSAGAGLVKDLLADDDLASANAALVTLGQGLPTARHHGKHPPAGLLEGAAHLRRTPLLAQTTFSFAAAMLVLGFYETVTFAVIAALHRPPSFFGVLMSVQAAGSIAGGLVATRVICRLGEARALGVALATWVAASTIYLFPVLPAAVTALLLFGVAVPLSAVAVATANQRYTPAPLQGRVFAASNMLTDLAQTLSIAIGAALIATTGYAPLLAAAAATLTVPSIVLLVRPASHPAALAPAPPLQRQRESK